ncbi:MAG: DUF3494 domain-containing protein [Betaproteobacteria bacterium]|nr:DUF3494 domain-containing protein [Betaproteobacteria bacterium]
MHLKNLLVMAGTGFATLLLVSTSTFAQQYLGASLVPFAVLAGPTVTCVGASSLTGDVGTSPGAAIVGIPVPCAIAGVMHAADATSLAAQNDLTTAFNTLTGLACTADLTGIDLGGLTLVPGVYCFATSAQLTGNLTLDAQGNPNAVWTFKTGSTLTTAGNVNFINGGNACGAQWRIGTSATIGVGSQMKGNILAQSAITMANGSNLVGRALARTAAVTLDNNNVSFAACGAGGGMGGVPPPFVPAGGGPAGGASGVPTLSEWAMIALAMLLAAAGFAAIRRRNT